jgi:hypothetical protein
VKYSRLTVAVAGSPVPNENIEESESNIEAPEVELFSGFCSFSGTWAAHLPILLKALGCTENRKAISPSNGGLSNIWAYSFTG